MPERFGLFTLIVLGESVIAVSAATAQAEWTFAAALTAVFGFALAAALWWMYFARFDERVFDWALAAGMSERRRSFVFGYGHLVVFAALAAMGVGVRLGIEEAIGGGPAVRAAPVLGIALAGTLAGLSLVQRAAPAGLSSTALLARTALVAGAVAVAVLGDGLSALALMALAAGAVGGEVVGERVAESRMATSTP
jgi:low temperature requirement protein LtrA